MADYLSRNMAPISQEQWQQIDDTVTGVARRILVGRRFIQVVGPYGPGVQTVMADVYSGTTAGNVNIVGEALEADIVRVERRNYIPMPLLYKDFRLLWRDIETSTQYGMPLDTTAAAAAADACGRAEDNLILNGDPTLCNEGLMTVSGRTTIPMSDWGDMGKAFADVVAATEALIAEGFFGPYAVLVSPELYADMNRVFDGTGVLEIEQVRKIATSGVFQTPILAEPGAVVIATGPQNLDLVIGQDMTTAFLQAENMNYYFRVFESIALRIKRPQAICTLEGGPSRSRRGSRTRERESR